MKTVKRLVIGKEYVYISNKTNDWYYFKTLEKIEFKEEFKIKVIKSNKDSENYINYVAFTNLKNDSYYFIEDENDLAKILTACGI